MADGGSWQALVEHASEMLCVGSAHGPLVYVNAAWQRTLGYTLDDLATMNPADLVAPEDRARYREVARRLVQGESVEDFEASLLAKDGRYVVCRGWAVPQLSPDGVLMGTIAGYHDVTAERAVERANDALAESEAQFRRLSDASMDGVAVSRYGMLHEVNAAWCRMFGVSEDDAIGTQTAMIVSPAEREEVFRKVEAAPSVMHMATLLRPDGTTFDGEITGRPITYRGSPARMLIVRDTTAWMRVRRLKNEFISTVSHELRTPLTAIQGAVKLLESGAVAAGSTQAARLFEVARTNCERLARLVGDLLDIERIEAGRLEIRREEVDPAEVVRASRDATAALASQAKVGVSAMVMTAQRFCADRDRVVQVLTNLVSNAVKFAETGSRVRVQVSLAEDVEAVRFAVTNVGEGIAPADIPRLFTKFGQLDASDARKRGGTGLGLAIAKSIVEQHGGRIGVESVLGGETTFWVEWPVAPSETPASGPKPP
jgi:PAS domain S-box-containing protein